MHLSSRSPRFPRHQRDSFYFNSTEKNKFLRFGIVFEIIKDLLDSISLSLTKDRPVSLCKRVQHSWQFNEGYEVQSLFKISISLKLIIMRPLPKMSGQILFLFPLKLHASIAHFINHVYSISVPAIGHYVHILARNFGKWLSLYRVRMKNRVHKY